LHHMPYLDSQVSSTCNVEALHVQYSTYYLGGSASNAYAQMLQPRLGQFDRRMRCSHCQWVHSFVPLLPSYAYCAKNTVSIHNMHRGRSVNAHDSSHPTATDGPPPSMKHSKQGGRQRYRSNQPIRASDVGRRAAHEAVYGCIPRFELRGSTESMRTGDSGPPKPCKLWPLRTVTRHPRHPQGLTS
jgi:hypothetical protein